MDIGKMIAMASALGSGGGGSSSPAFVVSTTPPTDPNVLWIDPSDNTGGVENDVLTSTQMPLNATITIT